ncbi:hypothetical protein ANN_15025 [Periplaneta americana]|uniref:Uncharacterized protein n=1 Tax=Periplaneta americana TaxID=6978 RepID=A0ABQ8SZ24_PERAM|nr:hypothetical protein ANN_15025 [Periplaneta americana]
MTFPNRWIGRGSADDQAPFAWPPRSPDFTTPDKALWGLIMDSGLEEDLQIIKLLLPGLHEVPTSQHLIRLSGG